MGMDYALKGMDYALIWPRPGLPIAHRFICGSLV